MTLNIIENLNALMMSKIKMPIQISTGLFDWHFELFKIRKQLIFKSLFESNYKFRSHQKNTGFSLKKFHSLWSICSKFVIWIISGSGMTWWDFPYFPHPIFYNVMILITKVDRISNLWKVQAPFTNAFNA